MFALFVSNFVVTWNVVGVLLEILPFHFSFVFRDSSMDMGRVAQKKKKSRRRLSAPRVCVCVLQLFFRFSVSRFT